MSVSWVARPGPGQGVDQALGIPLANQIERLLHCGYSGLASIVVVHVIEPLVEGLCPDRTVVADLQQCVEKRSRVDHSGCGRQLALIVVLVIALDTGRSVVKVGGNDLAVG